MSTAPKYVASSTALRANLHMHMAKLVEMQMVTSADNTMRTAEIKTNSATIMRTTMTRVFPSAGSSDFRTNIAGERKKMM